MNTSVKPNKSLRWVASLMSASMILLLCFVAYWLQAQFTDSKAVLEKELTTDLTGIQRELLDSIVFERYMNPLIQLGRPDSVTGKLPSKRKFITRGQTTTISYETTEDQQKHIDLRTKTINQKIDSMNESFAKLEIPDWDSASLHNKTILLSTNERAPTFRFKKGIKKTDSIELHDSANGPMLAFSLRNDITKTDSFLKGADVPDSTVIVAIESLLKSALRESMKDSLSHLFIELDSVGTVELRKAFEKRLHSHYGSLSLYWVDKDSSGIAGRDEIPITYNVYNQPGLVLVSGFQPYLIQKIIPQILFAIVLLSFVLVAFMATYRNLKKQIKLSDMKNSLISNMSHELKTPVATVKVALEAISDYGVINNPQQAMEYVQMAKLETQRLEMLINKALNTSLLEQGRLTLQYDITDIALLIKDVIQSLRLRLQQNNVVVNLTTEGDDFNINIDKLHVQGAILNIIDNSIKYGTHPTVIDILITAQSATITVDISDNGPGIPTEYTEQIFDKFFRVPTGDKHNVQGYGLGLSYVKQVMQLHGGMVQQRNITTGGSKFTLQFFKGR